MNEIAVAAEIAPEPEAKPEPAAPRELLRAWAQKNTRLLIWIIVALLVPYLLLCYTMAAILASGGACGG